jgi:hypothetical protein
MSYEPDRIRAFQASGYPTMRAYVNQLDMFFPMLMLIAAIAGAAGGAIRTLRRYGASEPA